MRPSTRIGRLKYIPSKCGGFFYLHDTRTWSSEKAVLFKSWRSDPEGFPAMTASLAEEMSEAVRYLFGGRLPPSTILAVPPRGRSNPKKAHAAGMLVSALGAALSRDAVTVFERSAAPAVGRRSRYLNLSDVVPFSVRVRPRDLVVVVDDVVTTGRTFERCRAALRTVDAPGLLIAYAFWQGKVPA